MNATSAEKAARAQSYEALQILRQPGAFLRETGHGQWPYEALLPGTFVTFRSRGLNRRAFEMLSSEDGLMPSKSHPGRWELPCRP